MYLFLKRLYSYCQLVTFHVRFEIIAAFITRIEEEYTYVCTKLKKTKTLSGFRYFLAAKRHNNCSYACIGVFGA